MELKQYLAILWHWSWLIVLGLLVAGGTAYIISKNTTPVYKASIHLLINQAPGEGGNEFTQIQVSERLARTYSELIKKRPVLEETAVILELPFDTDDLADNISVSLAQNTQIMVVSVEDSSAQRAALTANTLVDVFIRQNQAFQSARYEQAIDSWERAVEEVALLVENLERQIEPLGTGETAEQEARLIRLEAQLTQARANYSQAFNELQSLRVAQAREVSNIVVVEPAVPSTDPIRPRVLSNTLLAAVVGAMLSLGIVFLIEYLDDTIKGPDEIAQDTGLSMLGMIATIEGETIPERLVTQRMPRSPVAEAFRVLRTNLSFSAVDGGLRSLMVSSASPSEGKSTTAANLAIAMAQSGKRVILVDADLRRPTQHKAFSAGNELGLTAALLDGARCVTEHCQETATPGLRLLTSGPLPPNPSELLNSQRMHEVLARLQAEADIVIVDSPPVLSVADACILAAQVDGALLVVKANETRRDALVQAVVGLQKTEGNLLGVVMNQLRANGRGYYYYQNYSYDYAAEGARPARLKWLPGWLGALIGRWG